MDPHLLWTYAHVLLFVYWLGADLGVFLLARRVKKADLDFGQRMELLRMALIIDIAPRVCFALMFPVGTMLARSYGVPIDGVLLALVWVLGIAWVGLILAVGAKEGTPVGALLQKIQFGWLCGLTVLFVGMGAYALAADTLFEPDWLALKVLILGVICLIAIVLDRTFKPLIPAFHTLATEGATPELETVISDTINRALMVVIALYVAVASAAFLGVVGPGTMVLQ